VDQLRQAAQQALEALEFYYDQHGEESDAEAITALRAALAEPQQEPYCYHDGRNIVGKEFAHHSDVFPLFTAPQPRREVELTANAILNLMPDSIPADHDGALIEFARAVVAAYRAKQGETR
jgi:plasmid stabilization system protein ParE